MTRTTADAVHSNARGRELPGSQGAPPLNSQDVREDKSERCRPAGAVVKPNPPLSNPRGDRGPARGRRRVRSRQPLPPRRVAPYPTQARRTAQLA